MPDDHEAPTLPGELAPGTDPFWQINEDAVLHPTQGAFYEMAMDGFFNARHFVVIEGSRGPDHSHSYRLQVRCRSTSLASQDHVVVSYRTLRELMELVVRRYNNQLLNDLPVFRRLQPTTENLAAILFQQLKGLLDNLPILLVSVTVWESPTDAVTFRSG